ncbi:AP-1 complex subunit sigma-3-like isoform X3 [Rhinoraja longicauda]
MHFMLLFSRQGKLRLQKWYTVVVDKEKKKISRELVQIVLSRQAKMCSFVEWRDLKVIYKRFASLYFCCAIDEQDNELLTLEIIHRYVELLDKYFGNSHRVIRCGNRPFVPTCPHRQTRRLNLWAFLRQRKKFDKQVCELDIIFNFEKAYFILDEFLIGGEMQDTSKHSVTKAVEEADMMQETMEEYLAKPTF